MNVRILHASALAGVLALAACAAPAPTTGTPEDETALRAMGARFADAWNKGDVTTLVSMVTDDYEAVAPDGTSIRGRAAFEEMEKKQVTERTGLPLTLTVNTSYVRFAGANGASIGGTWTMAGIPAGMGADKGAWTSLAIKGADGQWQMATGLVAEYHAPPAMPMPPVEPGKGK
jgi:uncharacterized protein (TIGR02246 family)